MNLCPGSGKNFPLHPAGPPGPDGHAWNSTPARRLELLCRLWTCLPAILLLFPGISAAYCGKVVNAETGRPVQGAFVTLGDTVVRTARDGRFAISGAGKNLGLRAVGYWRRSLPLQDLGNGGTLSLRPFHPRAIYLSYYGAGSPRLRNGALALLRETDLNALVIDVKNDRGMLSFQTGVPLAQEAGAEKTVTVHHIRRFLRRLHQQGIYTVARIVAFRDPLLARARPELAVRTTGGAIWHDREGLAWCDPFDRQVWNYNIRIAVAAAQDGFDEIQFDYVRFPDARGLSFSRPDTQKNRVAAIQGFLADARRQLAPYNVFLSADIFGYVIWNFSDTGIGQKLEELAQEVDYICPMLYPSGFQFGIPGYPNPVLHAYQTVYLSLQRAEQRTGLPPVRFRPWLQAFRDYAFGGRPFGAGGISEQVAAARAFGSDGWMLWNPRNIYTAAELPRKGTTGSTPGSRPVEAQEDLEAVPCPHVSGKNTSVAALQPVHSRAQAPETPRGGKTAP